MEPDAFRKISDQIYEIRNFLTPLDLKLVNLDLQIKESRIQFTTKTLELETKINATGIRVHEHTLRIEEHTDELALQSERIRRLESLVPLKHSPGTNPAAAVHEDKANPANIRPPTPPA